VQGQLIDGADSFAVVSSDRILPAIALNSKCTQAVTQRLLGTPGYHQQHSSNNPRQYPRHNVAQNPIPKTHVQETLRGTALPGQQTHTPVKSVTHT
jgi:hypothetical protein